MDYQFIRLGNYTINLDTIAFIDWEYSFGRSRDKGVRIAFQSSLISTREDIESEDLWFKNGSPEAIAFKAWFDRFDNSCLIKID